MKLTCPKCRKVLPQIGNDKLYEGDTVTCGLCLHIWTPILPAPTRTSRLETDGRSGPEDTLPVLAFSSGTMCVRCAKAESSGAKPFVKWVGGKRSVLPELLKRMPASYGTYREAFVGGGALFFAVQPEKAYLSDINFHLVLAYQAVRDDVDRLIKNLEIHQRLHNAEYFNRARERLTRESDSTKVAALMIYLNKTCFNGLYRVNKAGGFNVPIGDYKDTVLFDEDVLRADSKALQGITITQHEFSQMPVAREDFYYFDPPYHKTFDGYNGNGFADSEHEKLAAFCREIHAAKAYFMLSNSDTPFVRSLYKGFTIEQISASRSVSCKGDQRKKENELLIRNY